jgi:hypothetical protein
MKIAVGIESLQNYQRLNYELHFAIAELVDNSIQAYRDEGNKLDKILKKEKKKLEIHIEYDRKTDRLTVADNSTGIDPDVLTKAFDVGSKKKRVDADNSLGEFNIGLKSSAIWLCDIWELKTKRYDQDFETSVTVVNEDIFNGNDEIKEDTKTVNTDRHYTVLNFEGVRRKFNATHIKKCKKFLSSMYRRNLGKSINIIFDGDVLEYEEVKLHVNPDTGRDWKIQIGPDFLPDGRPISGWVGVLAVGLSPGMDGYGFGASYENAGISIVRRGRMIHCQPNGWKPNSLFGATGQGSLAAQRIVGEIVFDGAKVSHDKSVIDPDDREILNLILASINTNEELVRKAAAIRVSAPISKNAEKEATENLKETINNSDLAKRQKQPIPPTEDINRLQEHALKGSKNSQTYNIGDVVIKLSCEHQGENMPYVSYEKKSEKEFKAKINLDHPYIIQNDQIQLTEYFLFILMELATRFKIENAKRLSMEEYFAVKDNMMRFQIIKK